MIIDFIDLKQNKYKVQRIKDETLLKIATSSYQANNSLIVLFIFKKSVILFSFLLAKIFRISLEDYNKYIKQFSHHIFIPKILLDLNIIVPKTNSSRVPQPDYYFRYLQLNLTPNCNLRCRYCYAMSGRRGENQIMSFEIAKAAIDTVSKYCGDELNLGFIGEGESTTQFHLLKKIFYYAKKKISQVKINPISTNGVFAKEVANWLIKNAEDIQISCDGPAFLQNKYRPLANGKGSSFFVERTMKYFIKNNKHFRVRVTMTDDFYGNELKVLNYFWQLGVNEISFGPLEIIGAAKQLNQANYKDKPTAFNNLSSLFKEFQKLTELQNELNLKIRSLNFPLVGTTVTCGIYTKSMFIVDPYGNVAACGRYNSPLDFISDPFMKEFIIGRYDHQAKKIKLNFKQLNKLVKIIDHQMEVNKCKTCSLLSACSTICLYSLGHQTGTINPSFPVCGNTEQIAPTIIFTYFSQRYFINKKPCLEYKNNKLFFSLLYTDFELSFSKNGTHLAKNPYILIDDLNNLKKIAQKIIKYKNNHEELIVFLLNFKIKQEFHNKIYAKKIINFLKQLTNNRVYFKVTEPLPKEMFSENYDAFCEEFDIPKTYKDSLELYRVANDIVYFSKNIIGSKKFSEYEDRNEIYEDYQKLLA